MVSCCPIWSHYRILLQVSDDDASEWYAKSRQADMEREDIVEL